MFEFLVIVAFLWLLVKAIGLAFRISWGIAKVVAAILIILACPILVVCVVFMGGIFLLIPVAMIAIAAMVLNAFL